MEVSTVSTTTLVTNMTSMTEPDPAPWPQIILMILLQIFGTLANLSIIFIVLKNKRLRSTPNIIVVNLTIGDILCLVINLPIMIDFHLREHGIWSYGAFACKLVNCAMISSGCVTVFSLMALAVERYLAIAWPWRNRDSNCCVMLSRKFCLSPTWRIMCLIWVGALLVAAPIWKTARLDKFGDGEIRCVYIAHHEPFAKIYKLFRLVVGFIIPLLIIVVAHALTAYALLRSLRDPVTGATDQVCHGNRQTTRVRSRVKLAVVISVLSVMFFLSWLPFYVFEIVFEFQFTLFFSYFSIVHEFYLWKDLPVYILSCINPIVLYILSTRFREQLCQNFCCSCAKPRVDWKPVDTFSSLKSSFLTASTFRGRSMLGRRSSSNRHEELTKL